MQLRHLRQIMLLPKKEFFINKTVKIRGVDVHLICITSEERRNVLWAMHRLPCNHDEGIYANLRKEYTSKKDEMVSAVRSSIHSQFPHISEITIQKQKMTFSLTTSCTHNINSEKYMKLQHFIESGMITINWDEVDLDSIAITAYIQKEGEEFPEIDLSKELDITLKLNKDSKEVLVNQAINLQFREMEKGRKFYFYDSDENKNCIFYINKMYHYDIWEEVNSKFEDEFMKVIPKEQIKQMKEEYLANLAKICPEGMDLAMLEFETEDEVQLSFYSKEYLDKRPVHNTSSSATAFFFKSDRKFGDNGRKSRVCMVKPVEKAFTGSIDAELFSFHMEIPEEIITV